MVVQVLRGGDGEAGAGQGSVSRTRAIAGHAKRRNETLGKARRRHLHLSSPIEGSRV